MIFNSFEQKMIKEFKIHSNYLIDGANVKVSWKTKDALFIKFHIDSWTKGWLNNNDSINLNLNRDVKKITLYAIGINKLEKKEIMEGFKDGLTIDSLSKDFNCTKLTIIRNLKINLGDENYKKYSKKITKSIKKNDISDEKFEANRDLIDNEEVLKASTSNITHENLNQTEISLRGDFYPASSFLEISPIDFEIDHLSRKELSSVPISEFDFPETVYMIVDKKIELEIKLLKDYPEWEFLPNDDLNRKTIEIYSDLKVAKRDCNKEQKVIKIPNPDVFKIVAPLLTSRGISRIVYPGKLIAL